MKPTISNIRKVLKAAGLYAEGSAGRGGGLGATRIWDYGTSVIIVPRAGWSAVHGAQKFTDAMLYILRKEDWQVAQSESGQGTSGEFDIHLTK